jgi:hypothetical protein
MIKTEVNCNKEIFVAIDFTQIENKYGGSAPNKVENFFPPCSISDDYGVNPFQIKRIFKRIGSLKKAKTPKKAISLLFHDNS